MYLWNTEYTSKDFLMHLIMGQFCINTIPLYIKIIYREYYRSPIKYTVNTNAYK